jgi:hypothetical protein
MRRAAVAAAAAVALAGCGGSDDDGPRKRDLEVYLARAGQAIRPIVGTRTVLATVRRRYVSRREAVRRLNRVALRYESAGARLRMVEPPEDLSDEHAGAVRGLLDYSRSLSALARAIREDDEGRAAPPRGRADFQRWADALRAAAEREGLDAEELLDEARGPPPGRPSRNTRLLA